jgi:ATP-dependent exoDNAse (exonuclease V) beta subunit
VGGLLDAREEDARREREEPVRLTYVAATRARDLLVLPVIVDPTNSDSEGWLDVMNPAVFPEPEQRRAATPAEGCPEFGEDSVFERPDNVDRGPVGSIAPGSHRPQAGSHRVVWWDPAVLELDQEQSVGLRQQSILEADEGEVAADEGVQAHERWQAARKEALERGAEPLLRVEAVTSLAEPIEDGIHIDVAEVAVDRGSRPSGRRFGSLVHATLAAVDLQADPSAVHQTVQAQARLLGATGDELAAAATAVEGALAHPLLQRAALAHGRGELRRETPVMLLQPDGTLAEGVVDLAFREENRWMVVDFKTDRELEPRRREYEAQVGLYVEAVAQATGEPAEGCLLVI